MKYKILFVACLLPCLLFGQNTLNVNSGTYLVGSDGYIVLKDTEFMNNGTFTSGVNTVTMTGTGSQAAIGGTSVTTFYNLEINKSANNATLEQDANVSNTLTLTVGNIDLQTNDLTIISGGGTTGGGSSSYVLTSDAGTLIQEVGGTAVAFPVGNSNYNPATLSNIGTTDNIGIRVTDQVLEDGTSGTPFATNVVNRTWMIAEETAGGSDLTLDLNWNSSDELPNFQRTDCYISHYDAGEWDQGIGSPSAGTDPYSQTRSGITTLSPFTVTSSGPLPVELLSFDAFKEGRTARLKWRTASEINNMGFYVERSIDSGNSFERLGFVEGAGDSSEELDYAFLDERPKAGMNYYRLKQVDFDGSYVYTEVRPVYFDGKINDIVLHPNPATKGTSIYLTGLPDSDELRLEIYAINGQQLLNKVLPNSATAEVWLWQLPTATYIYSVKNNGETLVTGRLIISDKQ